MVIVTLYNIVIVICWITNRNFTMMYNGFTMKYVQLVLFEVFISNSVSIYKYFKLLLAFVMKMKAQQQG